MKILILSALFPPDVSPTASYVKNLATRLSKKSAVTVLTFGHLPEEITGVKVICVDKRRSLISRLSSFHKAFSQEAAKHDMIIVNNAPSIDVPVLITNPGTPIVYIQSDYLAAQSTSSPQKFLRSQMMDKAVRVIRLPKDPVYLKPEELPFADTAAAVATNEAWWQEHLTEIIL